MNQETKRLLIRFAAPYELAADPPLAQWASDAVSAVAEEVELAKLFVFADDRSSDVLKCALHRIEHRLRCLASLFEALVEKPSTSSPLHAEAAE